MGGNNFMNYMELMHLKANLLCYGVKADNHTKHYMERVNPYVLDKGFMHAAHFMINDLIVNTCISESFCKKSPFTIKETNGIFELFDNERFISKIDVLPLPEWCKEYVEGYRIGDYLRPHSKHCIACWPYLKCNYYSIGKQCRFCSMGDYQIKTILPESIVGEMIKTAIANNPNYEVALSGGTCHEPDHSIAYFSKVCEIVRKNDIEYISVETAPPNELFYIDELKKSGATAIIMNLEIADEERRKIICPGKSSISQQHYLYAYERAVNVFGAGNVSCVLIAGIQKAEDIINKSAELIDMGVVPTIIPFKPLDGCNMRRQPITNPDELILIATEVDKLLNEHKLAASNQKGCTKCNGCSLETIVEQI